MRILINLKKDLIKAGDPDPYLGEKGWKNYVLNQVREIL